jgi:hypothetical protein
MITFRSVVVNDVENDFDSRGFSEATLFAPAIFSPFAVSRGLLEE